MTFIFWYRKIYESVVSWNSQSDLFTRCSNSVRTPCSPPWVKCISIILAVGLLQLMRKQERPNWHLMSNFSLPVTGLFCHTDKMVQGIILLPQSQSSLQSSGSASHSTEKGRSELYSSLYNRNLPIMQIAIISESWNRAICSVTHLVLSCYPCHLGACCGAFNVVLLCPAQKYLLYFPEHFSLNFSLPNSFTHDLLMIGL